MRFWDSRVFLAAAVLGLLVGPVMSAPPVADCGKDKGKIPSAFRGKALPVPLTCQHFYGSTSRYFTQSSAVLYAWNSRTFASVDLTIAGIPRAEAGDADLSYKAVVSSQSCGKVRRHLESIERRRLEGRGGGFSGI